MSSIGTEYVFVHGGWHDGLYGFSQYHDMRSFLKDSLGWICLCLPVQFLPLGSRSLALLWFSGGNK